MLLLVCNLFRMTRDPNEASLRVLKIHKETTESHPMPLKNIASLGKIFGQFLALFGYFFLRAEGRRLFAIYVIRLLSNLLRKTWKRLLVIRGPRPARCNGSLNRLSGTKRKFCGVLGASLLSITPLRTRSEFLTKRGPPRIATKPLVSKGSTTEIGTRSKMSLSMSHISNATKSVQCLLSAQMYLPKE